MEAEGEGRGGGGGGGGGVEGGGGGGVEGGRGRGSGGGGEGRGGGGRWCPCLIHIQQPSRPFYQYCSCSHIDFVTWASHNNHRNTLLTKGANSM